MGFLKRIFSIGSKKQKKRKSLTPQEPSSKLPSVDEEQRRKLEEQEHEAAVGRLLRSSSSRYAVVKEVDYSNLPPIPHPINDVLAHCLQQSKERAPSLRPSRSNQSLASSTLSHRSTYSVTIRDRQRHTTTEFPNANGHYDDNLQTPRNPRSQFGESNHPSGHALGLRSDPSVASLVDLYDDHGRLPPETFSNSPPSPEKQGRQQKMRSGSTLRELLGATEGLGSTTDSAVESDISWAERFLGEADSVSSQTSSFGPHTPSACTNDSTGIRKSHDLTFSTDVSASNTNDPAISSMEVELSVNSEDGGVFSSAAKDNNPYRHMDPTTPQRASQVFSFLTKRSTVRPASDTRDTFNTPVAISRDTKPRSRLSTDSSIPGPRASRDSDLFEDNLKTPMQRAAVAVAEDKPSEPKPQQVRVLMSGPTKVIVTAPTPGTSTDLTPSRIPIRGPRQPPKRRSTASRRTPMLTHRMNSTNRSVSPRSSLGSKTNSSGIPQRKPQSRIPSNSSTVSSTSSTAESDAKAIVCGLDYLARSRTYHSSPSRGDKENQPALTAQVDLPSTPLRSHTTSKSMFRKAVTPGMFQPPDENSPSPSSPSELTPVGKQIMVDARKQRMRAKYGSGRRPSRI